MFSQVYVISLVVESVSVVVNIKQRSERAASSVGNRLGLLRDIIWCKLPDLAD